MPRMIFAPSARQDLLDIFDYIARDKPIAAANWIDRIEEKCGLIATMPGFGERRPEYGPDIRSSVVGRYVIYFAAETLVLVLSPQDGARTRNRQDAIARSS